MIIDGEALLKWLNSEIIEIEKKAGEKSLRESPRLYAKHIALRHVIKNLKRFEKLDNAMITNARKAAAVRKRKEEDFYKEKILSIMYDMRNDGYSFNKIANELLIKGIKSRRGKIITATQVKRILTKFPPPNGTQSSFIP